MGKYGIIIKGKDRHVQIDSFNTVMNCIRKQTVVMKGGIVSGNQGYYTELPNAPHSSTKLFAVSPNNVFVKVIGGAIKGSDKNIQISQPYNDSSGSVDVFEFGDFPNNIFKEKYGVVIKNSSTKQTVYNSNWGVLKIVGYFIASWKEDIDYQLPNIKDLAFVFGGGMGGIWEDGFEGAWMDTFIKRVGNTLQVRYKEVVLWSTGSANRDLSRFPSTCLIIDVGDIKKVL
ncbi:TPA: hypothetical protein ACXNC1_002435 [Proteus mirabilis]|uniref:hypothetical protein n=1 Tax=Proteus TaxID=583 RepID=UPI000D56CBB9|nr:MULTISPECIES: hypothetical protein [Proteus]EIT1738622.1 hypothetical protein [Proteus mirabilis]EJG2210203.1 hypothetical protein [Proteus mirabilis]EKX2216320.1 hypothetical protein [Proteus mirabilis]EKX4941195.1 hypothetical protein [Proteus mirabilis]EKX6258148.1 hypothetical protein [Proteus mirabilis]